MTPTVSIVVVNWNSGTHLEECLDSLAAHLPGDDWDVTVVDNGSSDGSERPTTGYGPAFRLIRNDRNRGFGGGA